MLNMKENENEMKMLNMWMNLKVIFIRWLSTKRFIYISRGAFVSWNNLVYDHPYKIFESPKNNEITIIAEY